MIDINLINGDCIEEMKKMKNKNIKMDLILTDLPYGTTACKWDNIIPFKEMWDCLDGITNNNTPICLFGTEPFNSKLITSNINHYKYSWVWQKDKGTNIFLAKKQPMRNYELINVFYNKQCLYNPQMRKGKPYFKKQVNSKLGEHLGSGNCKATDKSSDGYRYPLLTLYYARDTCKGKSYHPTQKPVELLEYLIRTYTNEGDTVLDFTMGSGSTGVACANTNRNFIGIELDKKYFNIAKERINGVNDG